MKAKVGPWGAVPLALLTDDNVTPNMLKVYIVLSAYQGTNSKCWPSRNEISTRSGLQISAVSKAITQLVQSGWIVRTRRSKTNSTNVYYVLMDVETDTQSDDQPETDTDRCMNDSHSANDRCLNDSDYRCLNDSDIHLYNNNTNRQHQITAGAVSNTSPHLKDDLAQAYRGAFTCQTPESAWKSIPQELKHLYDIAKRTRRLAAEIQTDPHELARRIMTTFANLKRYGKRDYWRNAPFTPSSLTVRWDSVIEALRQEVESESIISSDDQTPF